MSLAGPGSLRMTQEESKGGTESEGDRRAAVREGFSQEAVFEAVNGGSKDWPEKGQDEQHPHSPQEGLHPLPCSPAGVRW